MVLVVRSDLGMQKVRLFTFIPHANTVVSHLDWFKILHSTYADSKHGCRSNSLKQIKKLLRLKFFIIIYIYIEAFLLS
jgi:hypothetical protein